MSEFSANTSEPFDATKSEVPGGALFEGSPDCVKLLHPDGHVLAMNENGQCLMEIEDFGAIAGKNWHALWPEEAGDKIREALEEARSGGKKQFQAFCPTAKGTAKWWDVSVVPIHGHDGRISGILAISRDVTALRQANEEMQASRERFLALLESSAEGIFGVDMDGRCTFLNAAGAKMLGYQSEELTGRPLHKLIHQHRPDGTPCPESECRLVGAAREGVSIRAEDEVFWHKDGSPVPVSYSVSPMILNGQKTGAVINFTNIADRKHAEADLRQLQKEVQTASDRIVEVFKQAPAFMCTLRGPDHIFELINQQYLQLVGHRDPIGLTVRQALPEMEGQGLFELLDHVYHTGKPFTGKDMPVLIQRAADGPPEQRFLDLVYMALRNSDGTITGILVHGIDQTDRKLAEMAQLESQHRVHVAAEAAALGLWSWNREEDFVLWENERPYEILGLSHSDAPINANRFVNEFLHPDDVRSFREGIAATIGQGKHYHFEGRIRRTDGEWRWIELFGDRQPPTEGKPLQVIGTISDITARKQAEAEIYESRERFQKVFSQAATGVVQADTQGRMLLVNGRFCEMTGYEEAELLGKNVGEITSSESLPATMAEVGKMVKGETSSFVLDKHYCRKDGSTLHATSHVNALRAPDGKYQGLVAIVVDVTESQRAAEQLRESEERYRTVFESMDQGFCIIEMMFDANGTPVDYRFQELNPVFEKHTGLADAAGKTIKELVPNIDAVWIETYGRVATTGKSIRLESWSDAMGRWFDVYATRIGDDSSRKIALLFSDITARKHTDEDLRRLAMDMSESDRLKTEFLATLAHELRNPLAPIRSGLAVMRLAGDNPETLARIRDMMDRQVSHMVHLIDDLLDVARISGGKLELKPARHELKDLLTSAVETSLPLIEAAHHELVMNISPAQLPVYADPVRIGQIVANLLNNAAKYTPPGGRIALSAFADDDAAVITVADNGVGIPEDSLSDVFNMFNQVGRNRDRAQGGLGIGLSLVRRLVEMHGGSVGARSAGAGKGSTFEVRLPLAAPLPTKGAAGTRPSAAAPAQAGKKLKILVVDDNVDAAEVLSTMLELSGHTTRIANDGMSGLELAKEFRPDVLFLDIGMPGMNGYETAKAIRNTPGIDHTVLVALTGWGAESDRAQSRAAGFDHHLTKPMEYATLQATLAKIADDSEGGSYKLHIVR